MRAVKENRVGWDGWLAVAPESAIRRLAEQSLHGYLRIYLGISVHQYVPLSPGPVMQREPPSPVSAYRSVRHR